MAKTKAEAEPKMKRYRHGDLVIDQIEKLPEEDFGEVKGGVLAAGTTGHAHRVAGNGVKIRRPKRQPTANEAPALFVTIPGEALVSHKEHTTINLPAGVYRVTHKRQYIPDGWTAVQD